MADPRIGLVLGAGGVMGGAWLTGALHALATRTRWDPATADHVVGTSAGSMIGGLLAAGVPPWFMVAHSAGETFDGLTDADGRPVAEADRSAGAVFRLHRGLPRLGPASLRLGLRALAAPLRYSPAAIASAWAPRGFISTAPLQETIRRAVPSGWAPHPGFWAVACDQDTGRPVAFGREDAPAADLADAVAASCAIPAFYRPVRIGGRHYVDGGVRSPSNADLLRGRDLDAVIVVNPMSSRPEEIARACVGPVAARMRRTAGRRLGLEARRLRTEGTKVVTIQPTAADLEVMGPNPMSRRNRHRVVERAIETVGEQLEDASLPDLPRGEPHLVERPAGPPETWPQIAALAPAREAA